MLHVYSIYDICFVFILTQRNASFPIFIKLGENMNSYFTHKRITFENLFSVANKFYIYLTKMYSLKIIIWRSADIYFTNTFRRYHFLCQQPDFSFLPDMKNNCLVIYFFSAGIAFYFYLTSLYLNFSTHISWWRLKEKGILRFFL